MPGILMQHLSSASFISDYRIRQLALCLWMCIKNLYKGGALGSNLETSCDTTASAQLSEVCHAGLREASMAHCWDSGAKKTLSKMIQQN